MKLGEIEYRRPSFEMFVQNFKLILNELKNAKTFDDFDKNFLELYRQRDNYSTMFELANIRYTKNTNSEMYAEEVFFFNGISPKFEHLVHKFYGVLNESDHKHEVQKKYGKHILDLSQSLIERFDIEIVDDLKEENDLVSQHIKLKGTAKIIFNDKEYNLAGMGKYLIAPNRDIRKKAFGKYWSFFENNQTQLDHLFDKLVKIRHRMGQKMGYENFIGLGYKRVGRVGRIGYTEEMIDNFRKQIVDEIVPITQELRERQRKRLGYSDLMDYDLAFQFLNGNPKPMGTFSDIIRKAKKMYADLSPETSDFFNYLLENDLMDLKNREGKKDNGYAWCISNFKHPFIFANFNGTEDDIRVLTHEAGHAFQYYKSRNYDIIEYREPSSELAEVHAMAMEFLTEPWMPSFFKEDTGKYIFSHINKSVFLMCYATAIDHFQHIIYKHPEYSPNQRASAWKTMEEMYLPDYKMDASGYLSSGRFRLCFGFGLCLSILAKSESR